MEISIDSIEGMLNYLFYPDWSNEITLPNNINRKQIKEIVLKSK